MFGENHSLLANDPRGEGEGRKGRKGGEMQW